MEFTVSFHVHYKSLASGAVGLIAFALSFLGVPKPFAWTLLGVGIVGLVAALVLWRRENPGGPPAAPQLPPKRPRGVGEADWLAQLPAAQAAARQLIADDAVEDDPSGLRGKHAQAVVSAYRDILATGAALELELSGALQNPETAARDLHRRADAWCRRCVLWASDAGLPPEREQAFRAMPAAPNSDATYFQVVRQNRGALLAAGQALGI